jgi:hypothetical protein
MSDQSEPPWSLLFRLPRGETDDDDIDLLEAMLRAEGLHDCPPWLLQRAGRLAQAATAPEQAGRGLLERAVHLARLVFDSWSTPRLAPLRSSGGMARHLLLRADTAEISLHLQPVPRNRLTIIGQVLGHGGEMGDVTLRPQDRAETGGPAAPSPDGAYGPVALDALGEFVVPNLPAGRYVLSVIFPTQHIDSEVLDLGGPSDGTTL